MNHPLYKETFTAGDAISLKEYLEVILKELRTQCDTKFIDITRETNLKFESRDKALELYAKVLENRLETLNEWRDQNKDERLHFLTKDAYESKHELLLSKVNNLELSKAVLEGKATQSSVMIAYLITLIGLSFSVFGLVHSYIK